MLSIFSLGRCCCVVNIANCPPLDNTSQIKNKKYKKYLNPTQDTVKDVVELSNLPNPVPVEIVLVAQIIYLFVWEAPE